MTPAPEHVPHGLRLIHGAVQREVSAEVALVSVGREGHEGDLHKQSKFILHQDKMMDPRLFLLQCCCYSLLLLIFTACALTIVCG